MQTLKDFITEKRIINALRTKIKTSKKFAFVERGIDKECCLDGINIVFDSQGSGRRISVKDKQGYEFFSIYCDVSLIRYSWYDGLLYVAKERLNQERKKILKLSQNTQNQQLQLKAVLQKIRNA